MRSVRPLQCAVQCIPIIILFVETEYDLKKLCLSRRVISAASAEDTLWDLHNSSDHKKAVSNSCKKYYNIHSK